MASRSVSTVILFYMSGFNKVTNKKYYLKTYGTHGRTLTSQLHLQFQFHFLEIDGTRENE